MIIINATEIEESKKLVLLGITSDDLLPINEHIYVVQQIINYMHCEE